MASSISSRTPIAMGNKTGVVLLLDITSYPTNGESLTPAILGLESGSVPIITGCTPTEAAGAGHTVLHDRANNKLKVFDAAGVEVVNTTDLGIFELTVLSG